MGLRTEDGSKLTLDNTTPPACSFKNTYAGMPGTRALDPTHLHAGRALNFRESTVMDHKREPQIFVSEYHGITPRCSVRTLRGRGAQRERLLVVV